VIPLASHLVDPVGHGLLPLARAWIAVRRWLIAILGDVLIAQCGLWCAVAQPPHEFGQAGSGGSRQHRTGMPQVVEAKVRAPGEEAGGVEVTAQGGLGQVPPVLGRKQQGVVVSPDMGGQMPLNGTVPRRN